MSRPHDTPRISVIIPTHNEQAQIADTLDSLRGWGAHEVIVVDGHSDDDTYAIAQSHGALVNKAAPGRANQMNVGADAATGDVVLFLHADTRLPADFVTLARDALGRPGVVAGAFALKIDAPGRSFRLLERLVHWRSRTMQRPYGDQALFLPKASFEELGRFPQAPIMEDYLLTRRLRRRGRIAIIEEPAVTSARRWQTHGVWWTTFVNQLCIALHRLGIPLDHVAHLRRRWIGGRQPDCTAAAGNDPKSVRQLRDAQVGQGP